MEVPLGTRQTIDLLLLSSGHTCRRSCLSSSHGIVLSIEDTDGQEDHQQFILKTSTDKATNHSLTPWPVFAI